MTGDILDSSTSIFTCPPDHLSLEFSLDFHFKENPNHPALIHPTEGGKHIRLCTYQELVPAIHRTGQWISDAISFKLPAGSSPAPVVAILLKTDTMTYLTMLAGLMRAGLTAFPVSPRFSSAVVAHLINETKPKAIIFNSGTQTLVNQALGAYTEGCTGHPVLCELPTLLSLYPGHDLFDPLPAYERNPGDISIMTHSSSSSSLFPKAVPWSSNTVLHHGRVEDVPSHQFAGKVLGGFGLELFHSFGMSIFFTMVQKGLTLAVMDPVEQSSILPADMNDVFRCFELVKPDFFLTNPRAIELWAEDPKKVTALRDSSASLIYGGRFLSKSVGDKLVKNGVKICSSYGATETGPITLLPHFQGDDWQYWTVYARPDVNFISRDDGLFEVVVAPTEDMNYAPVSNTEWDGRRAYNPGDLFIAHPTKPNTYKVFGRASDQIMLATGEMINPLEIESELSKHPLVSSAVMFGHSRFSVGIIIEPVDFQFSGKILSKDAFIKEIWPVIEASNQVYPSPIMRRMIILADPSKPIIISPKGLPRRPVVWLEYQDEIDALYAKDLKMHK